tara:strand:+ start:48 stop:275 length:228 start_codon:yes stop_codon:yes gene_type:complete
MVRAFIKGIGGITPYFHPGYNIVTRYKRNEEKNDTLDLFEYHGYGKTKKIASEKAELLGISKDLLEIVEFKKPKG